MCWRTRVRLPPPPFYMPRRRAYRLKVYTVNGRRYSVTMDMKVYELRKSGTRRVKGMKRMSIIAAIASQRKVK